MRLGTFMPSSMTIGGLRVVVLLYKALNGLRRPPSFFLELQKTVYEMAWIRHVRKHAVSNFGLKRFHFIPTVCG